MAAIRSCGGDQIDNDSIVLNRLAVGWAAEAAGVLKDAVEILLVRAARTRAVFRIGCAKGYWGVGYSVITENPICPQMTQMTADWEICRRPQ
jgi:hypothetical protein